MTKYKVEKQGKEMYRVAEWTDDPCIYKLVKDNLTLKEARKIARALNKVIKELDSV